MKLKYEFETVKIDGRIMAIPSGDDVADANMMIRLNDSASFIFGLLKEDITEEEIVARILKEYEGDTEEIKGFVKDFIAELKKKDILE